MTGNCSRYSVVKKTHRMQFVLLILLFFPASFQTIIAQAIPEVYWISFTDKKFSDFNIEDPASFLSEKSLLRREKQQIPIDSTDLPVSENYIDSLRRMGISVLNSSKWLNGVSIKAPGDSLLDMIKHFSFVQNTIKLIKSAPQLSFKDSEMRMNKFGDTLAIDYGYSLNQIEIMKGEYLHQQGYLGEGMLIAIEDAGFIRAQELSSLRAIWDEDRIAAIRDFTNDSIGIFEAHSHGSSVFSILAGVIEGNMYGTAPHANYMLLRTEVGVSEYPVEEYNWVCGAEFADSMGADIINTSLGYSTFDDYSLDYTYQDMDGKTTPSAIGAGMAASKGMILVVSAGNSGDDSWFHITTPADANNILSAGAVGPDGKIASFSSRGPSADQRIKPDVSAQGGETIYQDSEGVVSTGSGTSFSAPLLSGMAACLWQANPNATSLQVMQSIRESGSQFSKPDSVYGYGIPDFRIADRLLKNYLLANEGQLIQFSVYPNPANESVYIEIFNLPEAIDEQILAGFYDYTGRVLFQKQIKLKGTFVLFRIDIPRNIGTGLYFIHMVINQHFYSLPIQIVQ